MTVKMKKLGLIISIELLLVTLLYSQATNNPVVANSNIRNFVIEKIEIKDGHTYFFMEYQETRATLGGGITIEPNFFLKVPGSDKKYNIITLGNDLRFNTQYKTKKNQYYEIIFVFGELPLGCEKVDMYSSGGLEWTGIKINNPDPTPNTGLYESSLKSEWEKNGMTEWEGIYENTTPQFNSKSTYGLKYYKQNDQFQLIYFSGDVQQVWKTGDVQAIITKTATPNFFKAKWYTKTKYIKEDLYITFEEGLMKVISSQGKIDLYLKLYPIASTSNGSKAKPSSSGSGFALSEDGYIGTNQHVIDGARNIKVRGVKGNFSRTYNADIIAEDKNNDLAVIKINDPDFTSLGVPPYLINNLISDVGQTVFALGYPLRATMGDEVKLTNGIISSKTGFQGDITTYQVSVPVQPGNSGGPLFDSKGNITGIISAKHLGAENVSYAIKTSYLLNLLQVLNSPPILPKNNALSTKSLTDQVKFVKEFVYIIEIE